MPSQNKKEQEKQNRYLMRYAGLATQFLVGIALAVFIGLKADGWLHISIPVFSWLLPLLTIVAMLYKIAKDTSKK